MRRAFGSVVVVLVVLGCNGTFRFDEPLPRNERRRCGRRRQQLHDRSDVRGWAPLQPRIGPLRGMSRRLGLCFAVGSVQANRSRVRRVPERTRLRKTSGVRHEVTNRCLDVCLDEDDCLSGRVRVRSRSCTLHRMQNPSKLRGRGRRKPVQRHDRALRRSVSATPTASRARDLRPADRALRRVRDLGLVHGRTRVRLASLVCRDVGDL